MFKKPPQKRKIRRLFNKILFLCVLFFITLGSLLSVYILLSLKKHPLLTPVSIKLQQPQTITSADETTAIKTLFESNNIDVSKIESASDSAAIVTLKGGEVIILSTKKKLAEQIASLQLIIRQLTIEGRRYTRIDFRFDNPVVVF